MRKVIKLGNEIYLGELWGEYYMPYYYLREYTYTKLIYENRAMDFFSRLTSLLDKNIFDDLINKATNFFIKKIENILIEKKDFEKIITFYEENIRKQAKIKVLQEIHSYIIQLFVINDAPEKVEEAERDEYMRINLERAKGNLIETNYPIYYDSYKKLAYDIANYFNKEGFKKAINYSNYLAAVTILIANEEVGKAKKLIDQLNSEHKSVNYELRVAHGKIKEYREKKKAYEKIKNIPPEMELIDMAEDCRFSNGNINYSKLGRRIGRTHHTAKEWCKHYNII